MASDSWLPFTVTTVRWSCVVLLLIPFVWRHVWQERALLRRHAVLLFLLGGVGMGCFNLLMYLALNHTTAINVSIEQASMPVFIILANFIFLRQRASILQLFGLLVATIGVILTATQGDPSLFWQNGLNRGDAIMLLACVFYAAYSFGLRWKPPVSWHSFIFAMAVSAMMVSVPFTLVELSNEQQHNPGVAGWWLLAYIVLFPSLLGQLFFARGVSLIGAARAGVFINLVPIFGAVLAVLILRENFYWYHGVGLCMVLAGIALAEKGKR